MKPQFLLFLIFSVNSFGQTNESVTIWKSEYRRLSFEYYSFWKLLPTLDTKSKTLTGVIDNRNGNSYIIQITDDLPLTQLDNQTLLEGTKKKMLAANKNNKVLSEDSVMFHGFMTHRQIYLMNTSKWGLLKQVCLIRRTGNEYISVQICFPTTETTYMTDAIPEQTLDFDRKVKLLE